jgi:adenylate cyclase
VSFWGELKRRNVVRVAIAYIVVAWMLLQVSDTLVPALHLPEWFQSGIALLLILGFPIAMIFAWAFELTPEGLKKEKEVQRDDSITRSTGRKLDRAIIAILVVAVIFFAYDKFLAVPEGETEQVPSDSVLATQRAPSIAVLPFVNMSDDKDNEYFSDGLSEELLNLLAKIPELRVAARTSSFSFKGRPDIAVAEIARELKVAHVLEGSVRKSGDQIRITAQLIDANTGFHLWSETYDRELQNIFVTQDEIATNVTEALKVTLLGAIPSAKQTDPKAYELFLQGQYIGHQDDLDANRRAIELYEQALDIDPGYAPAWAELANNYFWFAAYGGISIADASAKIDAAVGEALRLDPSNANAYYVRGVFKIAMQFRITAGLQDYARALELEPGNAEIIFANGLGKNVTGQYEQGLEFFQSAFELDPLRPRYHNYLGLTYWTLGRYDEALVAFDELVKLSPDYPGAYRRISGVHIARGDYSASLAAAQQEVDEGYRLTALASANAMLGNSEESEAALQRLIKEHAGHMAVQVAEVYAYRGDIDSTAEWLEIAYQNRDPGLVAILGFPPYRIMHGDPRWLSLLEKAELKDSWLAMPPEWGGPQ